MKPIYMLCGVPGSGKTWVMKQLEEKYTVIHNDDYIGNMAGRYLAVVNACQTSEKPVICDCPFAERALREQFERDGKLTVLPYFIVEPGAVVALRYKERTGKDLPRGSLTRAATILNRAVEWRAPYGPAANVLAAMLRIAG